MDISVKGTKLKIGYDLDIHSTIERDNVGQCITLQARIPYEKYICFEYPESCSSCSSG